jgi:predicted acyltransferase
MTSNEEPSMSPAPAAPTERLWSLDALRGFDMLWIIGGDVLLLRLTKWADFPWHDRLAVQFEHADWEGFRFYDLIFPLFLFLVGAVLPFSLAKYGTGAAAYGRILRRTLLLVLLGIVCNELFQFRFVVTEGGLHLDWSQIRLAGVLQRIGICYGLAALVVLLTGPRTQAALAALILLGYWALLALVAPPGGAAGDFSKEGNLAGWIDRTYLPGKILPPYYGYGDNEGLLSTLPAVATTLLGALAGHWLRTDRSAGRKVLGLVVAGIACVLLGHLWGLWFPVIKNIWTSTFVLVAGGWSLLLLALFYGVIDGLKWRWWAFPLVVIGANAITIYVVPRFLDFDAAAKFFFGGLERLSGDAGPVVIAGGVLLLQWLFLYWLYRNRWFLRV